MFHKFILLTAAVGSVVAPAVAAAQNSRLAMALQQADLVVVGQVSGVDASWKVNAHGDQLIVSRAWVRAEEQLKGRAASDVPVEIEGGTIGDLTLKVSDMPTLRSGDRAVFLLRRAANGDYRPHLRGAGVLRVERDGLVRSVGLRLDDIRALARQSR